MDLGYPPEAEEFRTEIAGWLRENLPEGWGGPDFSMTPEERKRFNEEWTAKLFAGGWICASWPTEYGGKGSEPVATGGPERGVRPCRRAAAS
jgi:alkylation response protein AidB-like acyl-CoA dehydrogenase